MADFIPQNAVVTTAKKGRVKKLEPLFSKSPGEYAKGAASAVGSAVKSLATTPPDPLDMAKSAATGVTDVAESGLGAGGDRWTLAKMINDYFAPSSGMDLSEDIANAQARTSMNLPTTEDVQKYTDPAISALGAEGWMRHQPEGPWGQAAYAGTQLLDPLETGGPVMGKLGRLGRLVR